MKRFNVESNVLSVHDVTADESYLVFNPKRGGWVVDPLYCGLGKTSVVFAYSESIAGAIKHGPHSLEAVRLMERMRIESVELERGCGAIAIVDDNADWKLPPQSEWGGRLQGDLVDRWGEPDSPGKSPRRAFAELAMHLTKDGPIDIVSTIDGGVFARIDSCMWQCSVLIDRETGEAVAVQVK